MLLGQVIRDYLLADGGVTAAIGQRLFPQQAAAATAKPYAVYVVSGTLPVIHSKGRVANRLSDIRLVIDIVDDRLQTAEAGANAIETALADLPSADVGIRGCFLEDREDNFEAPLHPGGGPRFVRLTYRVFQRRQS